MAALNINRRRAVDAFEMNEVVEFYLESISEKCKKLIAHTATEQVRRLTAQKKLLEIKLEALSTCDKKGIIQFFRKRFALQELREKISELNHKIVRCITTIYRAFVKA